LLSLPFAPDAASEILKKDLTTAHEEGNIITDKTDMMAALLKLMMIEGNVSHASVLCRYAVN
jgi:hypothetical protein